MVEVDKARVDLLSSQPLPATVKLSTRVVNRSLPMTFRMGEGRLHRVRNSGKPGFEAIVTRYMNGAEEQISNDSYPVMNRVVELR